MATSVMPGETADETLLSRIVAGDAESFAAFYDRHCGILYGVACRILQNEADAQDVLQEACVLLWQRASHYDSSLGKPLSWAVTLVRNKAIDRLRSDQRRGAAVDRASDQQDILPVAPTDCGLGQAAAADTGLMVQEALKKLPPEQQEALGLAFFGGLTHLELASRLGAPLGTIKARIRRGLLALRDALEGRL
ncbi:MAG TPA: sigma-70 family RNA polymerase sigma factor [Candidatus Limnocylindria bacterium]|nr:sigma-70 family RNA polymerase sigma factor [Candidatus Limnocylindria bacterium]